MKYSREFSFFLRLFFCFVSIFENMAFILKKFQTRKLISLDKKQIEDLWCSLYFVFLLKIIWIIFVFIIFICFLLQLI